MMTMLDAAAEVGRGFSASTGVQAIPLGTYLNYVFSNPAGSGVKCTILRRVFFNNLTTGAPLEYGLIIAPAAIASPLSGTSFNMMGGGPNPQAQFTFKTQTSRLDSSPTTANPLGGILPMMGTALVLDVSRVLLPGQSFGYYVGGAGVALLAAARASANVMWIEEPA